ncbi:MAG TPA: c-type cytochrome [Rudaea sp.]
MSFRLVIVLAALLGAGAVSAQTTQNPKPPATNAPTAPAPATTPQPQAATAPAGNPAEPANSAPETAQNANAAPQPGDANAGQGKAGACGACHGIDGNPASSQYPKLAGQHEDYIARQLQLFKERHRDNPIMAGFAAPLQPQDMHDIGAYFATKTSLPGVADAKLVERGQALYRGGDKKGVPACMACHGPDGRGNAGAAYPQLAGQYADYVSAKLKEWHDGKTWGDDDRAKIMPTIAKQLSEDDIAALASYIEGLHSASAGAATAAK